MLHATEPLKTLFVLSSAIVVDAKFMPSEASHSKRCGLALLFGALGGEDFEPIEMSGGTLCMTARRNYQ